MTISFWNHNDSCKVLISCLKMHDIQYELLNLDNKELLRGNKNLKVKIMIWLKTIEGGKHNV